jgi:hypothetical protein
MGPLGDGLDIYGRPPGSDYTDGDCPMSVEFACWIVSLLSGFRVTSLYWTVLTMARSMGVLFCIGVLWEQGDIDLATALGVGLVVWTVFAGLLPVLAMAGSSLARVFLAIGASLAGTFLAALAWVNPIGGGSRAVAALFAMAWFAVPALLFTPRANRWYRDQDRL